MKNLLMSAAIGDIAGSAYEGFMPSGWLCEGRAVSVASLIHSSSVCPSHPADEHRMALPLPKLR